MSQETFGVLAFEATGNKLPLHVYQSGAGFYIGTYDGEGPCSRESAEYWQRQEQADAALQSGEWTQRQSVADFVQPRLRG